jgi:hypothetical protein
LGLISRWISTQQRIVPTAQISLFIFSTELLLLTERTTWLTRMKTMKKHFLLLLTLTSLVSQSPKTLKGTWQFAGGIYNGKKEGATKDYALQRQYTATNYQAFVVEKGYKPEKYETGNYTLKSDTCVDTETFSMQPSKITNIPIHYQYVIRHDSLILRGRLPTGMQVEEYWKRVK